MRGNAGKIQTSKEAESASLYRVLRNTGMAPAGDGMDRTLVFEKTPEGEAAVNQRTRLVQRNQRTVLILVDGVSTVDALCTEMGNDRLVDDALRQLQDDGLIRLRTSEEAVVAEAEAHAGLRGDTSTELPLPGILNPFATAIQPAPAVADVEDEPATAARYQAVDTASIGARPARKISPVALVAGGAGLLVAGFAILVISHAPEKHRAIAESALGGLFGGTAQIGQLASSGVPPTLIMQDVAVRRPDGSAARLEAVRAGLGFGVLFGRPAQLSVIDVRGGRVDAGALTGLAITSGGGATPLARVNVYDLSVQAGEVALPPLSGDIEFASGGALSRARLHTSDALWRVDLTVSEGKANLALASGEIKGFPDTATIFSSVKLNGELRTDGFRIDQIDIRAFDGIIEGRADVTWSSGWQVAGQATVKQVELARVAGGLGSALRVDGKARAEVRFSARAVRPDALWASSQGDGTLEVGTGRILGFDLTDSVRRSGNGPFDGGETRFDHLSAAPRWRDGSLELRDFTLGAGLMTAQGSFRVGNDALGGSVDVRIGGSASRVGGALELSGTPKSPVLLRR